MTTYRALMLVSGGGLYVTASSPEAVVRKIWQHNRRSMHNFDDGDILYNQRTVEKLLSGEAKWVLDKNGEYWCHG